MTEETAGGEGQSQTPRSPFPIFVPDAKCPKCGLNRECRVVWHRELEFSTKAHDEHDTTRCRRVCEGYCIPSDKKEYVWVPEHMHRVCGVCQYHWAEAPLT